MMRIITDSSCDLTLEEAGALNVEQLYMKLTFGKDEYIDKVTLSSSEFYKKLESSEEIPTTTLINSSEFTELYEKYPDDDLILITISSKLSGTYHSACVAKEASGRENIYIVDSKSVCMAQGLLVKQAALWRQEGLSAPDIFHNLLEWRERLRLVAVVDTLKYLIKGGRLSKTTGYIGNMLHIKPIIISSAEGEIVTLDKARGYKAALKRAVRYVTEDCSLDPNMPLAYAHSHAPEHLQELQELIGLPGPTYIIGSIVGTHAGPGTVAITYFTTA